MAPKRKPTDSSNSAPVAAAAIVTRRSPRLANTTAAPPAAEPKPLKIKKAKIKPAPVPAAEEEGAAKSPPSPAKEKPAPDLVPESADSSKTIIIEHCKQCNSFKTRAIQVKVELEKEVSGVNVVVNPEKPRRGCFEIREKGGDIFVSLLDMKRPFKPMKALDMGKVISDIIEKIR
ncbi:SelT/selW/selH selenoprotein domain containing protein [Striga asiatica]|uniref:SelT/selW/selH selenoprotein domain containing protein n=1 Tax=Striga asiatica TaxID=4170 RepID=A0A5A7PCA5_STRAF|nr:SelT/selW/selH selenoprotein domain containing protein [Striga asiatica]